MPEDETQDHEGQPDAQHESQPEKRERTGKREKRGKRKRGDAIASRREANRELGKARKGIEAVRAFYICNAMLSGIALALSFMANLGPFAIGIAGVLFAVAIAGTLRVRKEPFAWSLVLAIGWTINVLAMVALGAAGADCSFVFACLWTLGCWYAVRATSRAAQLMKENPDLRITRKIKDG